MFEKRLKEISDKLNPASKRTYFILTHKKHKREVYFQNNDKAIKFIGIKFDPLLEKFKTIKRIVYFLIRMRILQIFLKKIILSSEFGNVIFVAEQIKSFNLEKKVVISFPLEIKSSDFIKSKEFQKKVAIKGFAPKIFEINKKIPYSVEELLPEHNGKNNIEVFNKLFSYYKINGIKEITLKKYISFLEKKLNKKSIKDPFIKNALKSVSLNYPKNTKLKIVRIHGNFGKDHILLKNNSYVFTDWSPDKSLIVADLVKFFKNKKYLLKNKKSKEILKIFPKKVQQDIILYLILIEIYNIVKREEITYLSISKIKNLLNNKNEQKIFN